MATKMQRAWSASGKNADNYVDGNRRYLSHEYCMSEDQITQVRLAYQQGFLAGVAFK